jgi:hypothetical protein
VRKAPKFDSEAALCAAFIAWLRRDVPAVKWYSEWAGWDILLVLPEGWQIGVQAKIRLNAEVLGQAAPSIYDDGIVGPDFRAILVPERNGWSGIAERLGLVAFWAYAQPYDYERRKAGEWDFLPVLCSPRHYEVAIAEGWTDWSPVKRHELPAVESTDSIAGSSAPVTLTPWKLGALRVLAELAVGGTITTKRIRQIGISPARWTTSCWLMPGEKRGDWVRGTKCPRFDEQHPTAFAAALAEVKTLRGAEQ